MMGAVKRSQTGSRVKITFGYISKKESLWRFHIYVRTATEVGLSVRQMHNKFVFARRVEVMG